MLASARRVESWFDLTPADRCLCVSPISYAHGLEVTVFVPLLTGGSIAFPENTSKFDYSEWFCDLKPTWYSASPTLHHLVLDGVAALGTARDPHFLRFILSGGAALPRQVMEQLHLLLDVPVLEHYGSSEGMQICSNKLGKGHAKPGTCGIPEPGTVAIVDDNRCPLVDGAIGQILVSGPTVISGYLDNDELTRQYFVDSWFASGDSGSIDHEGFLTLHGRTDDLINRGGEKISPFEIEDALLSHPAVVDAAAFATAHPRLGQEVTAAVVPRPGAVITVTELRRRLSETLAPYKVPRKIFIVDKLPKGESGKILRHQLTTFTASRDVPAASGNSNLDGAGELASSLVQIWERLLKTSPITLDDDFFEKGGDSLLAAELLVELERLTGQTLPASVLFDSSTISQLVKKLGEGADLRTGSLVKFSAAGSLAPIIYFHGDPGGWRLCEKAG